MWIDIPLFNSYPIDKMTQTRFAMIRKDMIAHMCLHSLIDFLHGGFFIIAFEDCLQGDFYLVIST